MARTITIQFSEEVDGKVQQQQQIWTLQADNSWACTLKGDWIIQGENPGDCLARMSLSVMGNLIPNLEALYLVGKRPNASTFVVPQAGNVSHAYTAMNLTLASANLLGEKVRLDAGARG